jgi:hypothetical protein
MRDFHMTETAAMNYPINRALALLSFHIENHPESRPERSSPGYIAQEAARRAAITP